MIELILPMHRLDNRNLPPLDLHHLEFARWLVRTGRLSKLVRVARFPILLIATIP